MSGGTQPGAYPPQLMAYVAHFNAGEFFEAHEVLEELWWERDCDPFWQGLIIFAAAYEKVRRGEASGARKHFEAALRYLEPFRPGRDGVDVEPVLARARHCLELLEAGVPVGELPRHRLRLGGASGPQPPPASDQEIEAVVARVVAGERRLPSVLKEALLQLAGRAGRSRIEPVVRRMLGGR